MAGASPPRPVYLFRVSPNPFSLGVPALLALLTLQEFGLPIPIPSDLVMLLVGERASAGTPPLLLAVVGLEAAVVVGTAGLFAAVRGPAARLVPRFGPRVGLTARRLEEASRLLETRGAWALILGRTTPGLRTVTVVAAAGSGIPAARALPLLIAGGTIFAQIHLAAGFAVGPAARRAFTEHGPAVTAVLVAVALLAVAASVAQRHRRQGAHAWIHAACPACAATSALIKPR